MCGLGGQFRRSQRDPVLAEEIRRIAVTSTRRGTQPLVCLPRDYISGFLLWSERGPIHYQELFHLVDALF